MVRLLKAEKLDVILLRQELDYIVLSLRKQQLSEHVRRKCAPGERTQHAMVLRLANGEDTEL